MAKREILDLDLKMKYTKEYLDNGGIEKIPDALTIKSLMKIKTGPDGKVDPDSIDPIANTFMMGILMSHKMPPFFHPEYISEYHSILQKTHCFEQENIDTREQFDNIYKENISKENTIFRGQREAKWRLYSKLQRQWITDKLIGMEESYQIFIERLVEIGRKDYGEQIKLLLNESHSDVLNTLSVLSFLQHHGCPTPLLDWSYRFQVALFFAIEGLTPNPKTREIEDYFSVYFIEEEHFEDGNLSSILKEGLLSIEQEELSKKIAELSNGNEKKRKAMEKHFAGRHLFDWKKIYGSGIISHMTKVTYLMKSPISYFSDKDRDSGIRFSIDNNKNIQNQSGVFTWNTSDSKPIELLGDEINKEAISDAEANNYKFCKCLNINKKLEGYIRKRLEVDGITKEFIYPTPEVNTWSVFEKCKTK